MAAHRDARLGLITAPILAGVERLWANRNLLINGMQVAPAFWFDGTGLDDTAKTWTCRQTETVLSEAGSGSSPDLVAYGPHLGERGAEGKNGKYLDADAAAFGDVGLDDLVVMIAMKHGDAAPSDLIMKFAAGDGWQVYDTATAIQARLVYAGPTYVGPAVSANNGEHGIFVACFNRDENSTNGSYAYWNATAGTGVNVNGAVAADLDNSQVLTLLGTTPAESTLFAVAMWHASDWFSAGATGKAEMDALAKELTALYFGHQALHNHDSLTPSTL